MDVLSCGVTELDAREMRETDGGGRLRVPVGYTLTGEPIYADD